MGFSTPTPYVKIPEEARHLEEIDLVVLLWVGLIFWLEKK